MSITRTRWWRVALLFIMGITWGLQFSLLKFAAHAGYSEIGVLTLSMIGVAVIFITITWRTNAWFRPTPGQIAFFFISGTLGYLGPLGLTLFIAPNVAAGLLAIIVSMTPVFTVTIALGLRTEPVSPMRIAGIFVGAVAAMLVLTSQSGIDLSDVSPWAALAFVIPVVYAADNIYVAACWPKTLDAVQVMTAVVILSAILLTPIYIHSGDFIPLFEPWGIGQWSVLLFVLTTAVESYLYFDITRRYGAVFASLGGFISVFAGIMWGMALFGERHSALLWSAVPVMFLAIYLVTFSKREPREPQSEATDP